MDDIDRPQSWKSTTSSTLEIGVVEKHKDEILLNPAGYNDVSNKEQVVVSFRSVNNLEPHENFVAIHNVQSIQAHVLVETL